MARIAYSMAFLAISDPPLGGPQGQFRWVQMAPTRAAYGQAGTLSNPDPTEIHLALDIWSHKGRLKCPFYGIFRPILAPRTPDGNNGGSKWHQKTILDVSQPDLTYIH